MDVKRSMRRSYQFELSLMILLSINRLVETNFGFYLFFFVVVVKPKMMKIKMIKLSLVVGFVVGNIGDISLITRQSIANEQ